jgi:hypothetical protein
LNTYPHILSYCCWLPARLTSRCMQFWDASGTSLPTYSGINRRLLSATTSELLTSLAHTSRRSVLSIIVPGAETTQGGKHAISTVALAPAMAVVAEPAAGAVAGRGVGADPVIEDLHLRGTARRALKDTTAPYNLVFSMLPALAQAYTQGASGKRVGWMGWGVCACACFMCCCIPCGWWRRA